MTIFARNGGSRPKGRIDAHVEDAVTLDTIEDLHEPHESLGH
jgi:hypothetical protein